MADRCSSLRSFLRFLRMTGRSRHDLATCVVAPRIRMAERPPRALPWVDVRRILRSILQTRSPGKRDYAMLLMMATYGLGAAEVLNLRLEDVDWKSAVLRVRRPKTGVRTESQRTNSVVTRNCRLAALRSFVQHLLRHDLTRADQY